MTGTPDVCAYARGIADALAALGGLFDQPPDASGNHPLSDMTTWEIRDLARGAILDRCRAVVGSVPEIVRQAGRSGSR